MQVWLRVGVVVLLGMPLTLSCGRRTDSPANSSAVDLGGTTPPTDMFLSWRNQAVGIGSARPYTLCCDDPVAYTCGVTALDTPFVIIHITFQDQQGGCLTPKNCWSESGTISPAGRNRSFTTVKHAPDRFTPSIVSCWAENARGMSTTLLSYSIDVPKGIGP
jgi:hypothetical protein